MAKNCHFSVIFAPISCIIPKNCLQKCFLVTIDVQTNILCEKNWHLTNFEKQKVEKPLSQIPYILAAIDDVHKYMAKRHKTENRQNMYTGSRMDAVAECCYTL